MGRIIPVKMNMEPVLSNDELKYAVKHQHDGARFVGKWRCDQFRDNKLISGGYFEKPNIMTTEGCARLLNIIFHDIAKAASEIFYVALFKNNVTPAAGNTAAVCQGAAGTYGSLQDADFDDPLTNNPSYTTADTATATITNAVAGKAEFTIAQSITVYGSYLTTDQAKTGVAGYLFCAKRFAASRAVIADDVLAVSYEISITSS